MKKIATKPHNVNERTTVEHGNVYCLNYVQTQQPQHFLLLCHTIIPRTVNKPSWKDKNTQILKTKGAYITWAGFSAFWGRDPNRKRFAELVWPLHPEDQQRADQGSLKQYNR